MIIKRMALPRRTFIRGMGTALALPFLDSMLPALSMVGKAAAAPARRLGFFYVSNGMYLPNFHPAQAGKEFELTPILSPLASVRDQMTVITGLSNRAADTQLTGGGPHTRGHSAFLNGTRPKHTEGADIESAITLDQHAAAVLGRDTQLQSLELGLEPTYSGNCDNGYSCTYVNTFSWRTPTTPLPMERNPRVIFERLFGQGGTPEERRVELQRDRSLLDALTADLSHLKAQLPSRDRLTVDEYVQAVRDVEHRIQKTEERASEEPLPFDQPLGVPEEFDEHARLIFDLLFLAYQADITRVSTFQIAREQSGRAYPWIGVSEPHHGVSHHGGDPEKIALKTKIDVYHMELFARFLEKMRSTSDGDGTLLDHSIMLYGAGLSDGNLHSIHNLPIVLVGGGGGQLEGGRHLNYPLDTPMMNLGLSVLEKVGVHLDQIGDSTGPLTGV